MKNMIRDGQKMYYLSTTRTRANISEQLGLSPPFGIRERLKQGYKRLEAFLLSIDSKTDSKTAKFGEFI
jgi:hypothetical protein